VLESGRLEVRAKSAGATVNDVEIHGPTILHAGDLVAEGDVQYLVVPVSRAPSTPRRTVLTHSAWLLRLDEELGMPGSTFAVLLGRSGAFGPEFLEAVLAEAAVASGVRGVGASFGIHALEVLVMGETSAVDTFRRFISGRAERESETVRWGLAWFPKHGATAEELWAVAANRVLGLELAEPGAFIWSDPCMTRLRALAERWASRQSLGLVGAEGVGRESLARVIRGVERPEAPFIVHRDACFDKARWSEDISRAAGGSLHVRRPEILPPDVLRSFWAATSFRPSVNSKESASASPPPENRIVIPDLALRPGDLGPIAEVVLHSVDAQLGRRRSSLRAETRAVIQALPMPENVRSLRNVVIRAALSASGAEIRPEHLDVTASTHSSQDVRAKLRETERREIEAILHSNGWNVTEAARRMKLPRRTLVYRITRLGLRRPDSSA
jgi:hypothetical protein